MRRTNKLLKALKGWEFDIKALRESEGALTSLDRRSPRAFSTNVSNDPTQPNTSSSELNEDEWCNYANMPSPKAYM